MTMAGRRETPFGISWSKARGRTSTPSSSSSASATPLVRASSPPDRPWFFNGDDGFLSLLAGHPRNIHFPFDIEADTSISVASEMVAELDLTHQDVTAIAAMIDAEIQSHVPEWVPGEVDGEGCSNSPAPLDDSDAGNDDGVAELPPPAPEADHHPGPLVLERLPSGRKYWSDSPRGHGGDAHGRQSRSESFEMNLQEITDRRESSSPSGSTNSEEVSPRLANGGGPLNNAGEGDAARPSKDEPENVKVLRGRLEDLLLEQEKEMEELKKKHKRAVEDVLKELPAELRAITLGLRGLNLRGCAIRDEVEPNLRPHS